MEQKPTTSVVMPVRNGEAYVAAALGSVLDQLSADDEIIVVDDASTDGTVALVQDRFPRAKLLRGEGAGPGAARNLGLAAASGTFIAFLDHDDLWPAGRQGHLLAALQADDSIDVAVGRIAVKYESPRSDAAWAFLDGRHHALMVGSCLYRRRCLDAVGGFDPTLRYGEDHDYYIRLLEAGVKFRECDIDALIYRRHDHNITRDALSRASIMLQILARKVARNRGRAGAAGPLP
jgi:glycosyltransferase involved in cell wall biosynthesis